MIDAHVHIWRLGHNDCSWPTSDLPAIHRDFGLADVSSTIAGTGIERVILVQSQESERDTHWLLREAAASTVAAGVVGWLDPARGDMAAQIARAGQLGPLVGLRAMAQDRSPAWLASSPLHEQCAAMANADLAL